MAVNGAPDRIAAPPQLAAKFFCHNYSYRGQNGLQFSQFLSI
jgi:hypothetical protein